jgi:hypothetical protein
MNNQWKISIKKDDNSHSERTITPFVFILDIAELQQCLIFSKQDILKWSLYIDFAILNIEIITFKSDPSTTTASSTDAITPEKTNDGSKDNVIAIIIGAVLGTFGLIIIITIIVCVMRRKTNHDNVTNHKHGNNYNRRYQTGNNSGNH